MQSHYYHIKYNYIFKSNNSKYNQSHTDIIYLKVKICRSRTNLQFKISSTTMIIYCNLMSVCKFIIKSCIRLI